MPQRSPDIAACRRLLRGGSRSFFAASLLLPADVRASASALYAFCRLADDAVDGEGVQDDVIPRLRERLDCAYAGRPHPIAADRAFAEVVVRHAIPRALPAALLEGFEWDASGRGYDTIADLYAYAARVAGTVGAMMTLVMDVRAPVALARAADLGVAMQLTNIARDVGEDARAGRLYLPRRWLREAGLDPDAWLARPQSSAGLNTVVERLLDTADALYERADAGIDLLPAACRPAIHAARRIYAEIGRELERQDFDSVTRRAVVPASRKARLLAGAFAAAAGRGRVDTSPPLEATRFLVTAVAAAPVRPLPAPSMAGTVIALFERLERRDRFGGVGT